MIDAIRSLWCAWVGHRFLMPVRKPSQCLRCGWWLR